MTRCPNSDARDDILYEVNSFVSCHTLPPHSGCVCVCVRSHTCFYYRPQYYKVIEESVSQIVLHRSGMDPDFGYRERLDIDLTHLVGRLCHWKPLILTVFGLVAHLKFKFNFCKTTMIGSLCLPLNGQTDIPAPDSCYFCRR